MTVKRKVPDVALERLALGQLPPDYEKEVIARLRQEPGGMARLDALKASNEEILETYPSHLMAIQIKERAARADAAPRIKLRVWIAAPVLAAAAVTVALIALMPIRTKPIQAPVKEEIILKGVEISVFKKGEKAPLAESATVRAGDVLQLKYRAGTFAHGVIFSVDGRGGVTLHFPSTTEKPTALKKDNKLHALPYSYELDDAPDFERFFFVRSNKPIDVRAVLDAGKRLGANPTEALDLPEGLEQSDFLLYKSDR